MRTISALAALTLFGALAIGPTAAAPQFSGTNPQPGEGSDQTVDCSDQQYRFMPYCEMLNGQPGAPAASTLANRRTNSLSCPDGNIVAGLDRNGHRLYRCVPAPFAGRSHSPALTFAPGY